MINKWCGKVVLWISIIQIPKIHAKTNGSLLLLDQNEIGHPLYKGNQIDKTILE